MRKLYPLLAAALVVAACAGGTTSTGSNTGAGGGKATLDLTVSGATQGSTDKIIKHDCTGASFGTFLDTWTVELNGKEYELGLMTPVSKTPVTVALGPDAKVLLEINDRKTGTGGWRAVDDSTGTITIDAGADSGSVDAHNMSNALPGTYNTRIDMKFTFVCPAKK